MVTVRTKHIRAAGLCTRGARAWFHKYNLDWSAFVTDGLPDQTLRATGDPLALRAVEQAEKDEAHG